MTHRPGQRAQCTHTLQVVGAERREVCGYPELEDEATPAYHTMRPGQQRYLQRCQLSGVLRLRHTQETYNCHWNQTETSCWWCMTLHRPCLEVLFSCAQDTANIFYPRQAVTIMGAESSQRRWRWMCFLPGTTCWSCRYSSPQRPDRVCLGWPRG